MKHKTNNPMGQKDLMGEDLFLIVIAMAFVALCISFGS